LDKAALELCPTSLRFIERMKCQTVLLSLALSHAVHACLHEHAHPEHLDGLKVRLSKRQQDAPVLDLDENESILSAAFDNTTIESWAYYYTHGLHIAGTNKSQAQWTADRWTENGFDSSLAEYCEYVKLVAGPC
jgi:N-acetylated-alpha-linked acidic dipeptidase